MAYHPTNVVPIDGNPPTTLGDWRREDEDTLHRYFSVNEEWADVTAKNDYIYEDHNHYNKSVRCTFSVANLSTGIIVKIRIGGLHANAIN